MHLPNSPERFVFGDFDVDTGAYELRRLGRPVRLSRQSMELLLFLIERRGLLVTRTEIVDRLWGKDVFVDVETGINTAISRIRQALRDPADAPAFLETVPGKGYRFVASVQTVTSGSRAQPSLAPAEVLPADVPPSKAIVTRSTGRILAVAVVTVGIAIGAAALWNARPP